MAAVVCKGCSKRCILKKETVHLTTEDGGGERESSVFRAAQLGRIITLQVNILEYNLSDDT